jgi:hypothetical protein
MEIERVEGVDAEWDAFVWNSPGGTIFHTLRFLSYHPADRFDFDNLAIKEAGRLVCVIPGGRLNTDGQTRYVSPLGASFGGFVFGDDVDLETMFEAIGAFADHIRTSGLASVEITLPPACYFRSGSDALGFALSSSGFGMVSREATAVVPLASAELATLAPNVRRNVRKGQQSGVTVRTGRNVRPFHEILTANLAAKGAAPTHSAEEMEKLFELFPEKVQLFEAWLNGKMAGGCLTFICNARTALAFYICDDPDFRQFRIAECVLHSSIAWFKGQGYRYLDFGTISTEGQVNWGLARFKSKFMAETYVREKYVLTFEVRS